MIRPAGLSYRDLAIGIWRNASRIEARRALAATIAEDRPAALLAAGVSPEEVEEKVAHEEATMIAAALAARDRKSMGAPGHG